MLPLKKNTLCLLALILSLPALLLLGSARAQDKDNDKEEPIRIGMVSTLFTDVPRPLAQFFAGTFGGVMREFTGMNGKMSLGGDHYALGKDIAEGKLDLGVFHGVEFAWAQKKYPNLKPLMVACTKYKYAQAVMVVSKEGEAPVTAVPELKGKIVALPLKSREHCRLFLSRNCNICGVNSPRDFFSQIAAPLNAEEALDDVCLNKAQAAVVDLVALETYGNIKPGCFARLRVLKASEHFPTGVIAYRDGAIDQKTLDRFSEGLNNANKTARGRDLMDMFKITSFEPVPADYPAQCADIMKIYPPTPVETPTPVSSPR